jgi:tetratricopeptide (TPR) repeat protein
VLSSFAGVLLGLERQSPVLLVVEALEHASDNTLEALHFIASRVADHRLLILATVDAADSDRVVATLGDIAREVHLGPLALSAVTALLQRTKSSLDPRRLLELTAGSPLYLTELIRHGQEFDQDADGHVQLPASLRATITHRLTVVGAEVIELLQLGAIFGDTFTLDEVASLGQLRVEECAGRMQRALRADLVIAHRASFGFANKILREVLYQSTPEPTRINRHRRAAAILAGAPEAAAAQWSAGGAWREAITAWREAAETAHRALSTSESDRLLSAAERAARHLGDVEVLAEVLIRRGQIHADLGNYGLARDDLEEALAIARELMDDVLEARALEQLGWTALYARDALATADLAARTTKLAEAAAAAPGASRSTWLLLGGARHRDGDLAGASLAYEQVISEHPNDEIAAQALTLRGAVLQHLDRFAEARRTLAEAVVLCRSNGLFRPLLQALFFTALSLGDSGDFSAALRSLQRAHKLIDDNGTTYYSAGIDTTTSWLLRETGQLGAAREVADRAVESAERGGGGLELEQGLHAFLAVAECELVNGNVDAAGALVESALPFLERPLPYHARAHMRLLEMQARFEPPRAEELLLLARTNSSAKYESLALWHLGQAAQAAQAAAELGSDQLIAQVGESGDARQAILRLADALPVDQRERFMADGRLPQQWRAATGRVL